MVIIVKLDLQVPKNNGQVRRSKISRRGEAGDDSGSPLRSWLDEEYSHGPWNPILDARVGDCGASECLKCYLFVNNADGRYM